MQFDFFPSSQISWYMARLFLTRTFAVLTLLVVVLQTLDLLGESGDILAYAGNGDAQLWHYVGLRIPQIVARFLPFSVLLGTLIMLASMNQNSEIVSMKAAGLSAHQILAPLIASALGVAIISYAFNERVVTRATAALSAWLPAQPQRSARGKRWITVLCPPIAASNPIPGSATATTLSLPRSSLAGAMPCSCARSRFSTA